MTMNTFSVLGFVMMGLLLAKVGVKNCSVQMYRKIRTNQSVENAGVSFVKGANERNELFEKINKH